MNAGYRLLVVAAIALAGGWSCAAVSREGALNSINWSSKRLEAERFFQTGPDIRLAIAAEGGDIERMSSAIAAGANVNAFGHFGMAMLYWPLVKQNFAGFRYLLERGADPNVATMLSPDSSQADTSAMGIAVSIEDSAYLALLLQHGANPNLVSLRARQPVMFSAILHNRHENVRLLLESGANPNAANEFGDTALHKAVWGIRFQIAQLLLKYGGDPSIRNRQGGSAADSVLKLGDRGIDKTSAEWPAYLEFVAELRKRGLIP